MDKYDTSKSNHMNSKGEVQTREITNNREVGNCYLTKDSSDAYGFILSVIYDVQDGKEYMFTPVKLNKTKTGNDRLLDGYVYVGSFIDLTDNGNKKYGLSGFTLFNANDYDKITSSLIPAFHADLNSTYNYVVGGSVANNMNEIDKVLPYWDEMMKPHNEKKVLREVLN